MLFKSLVAALLISTAIAGPAKIETDSPAGADFIAKFTKTIQGSVEFKTTSNGSVEVLVDISGLPTSGGPFLYHVHQLPVDSTGNCYSTLGHLNPYNGSETATTPADFEVGDLSGKHGKINGTSLHTSYVDPYLSLNIDDPAYAGNLSVVVHFANTSRIACANITSVSDAVVTGSNSSSNSSSLATDSGAGLLTANGLLVGLFLGALSLFI